MKVEQNRTMLKGGNLAYIQSQLHMRLSKIKKTTMNVILRYLTFLIFCFSSNCLSTAQTNNSTNLIGPTIATGDTVNNISNNIMVIYQDMKNNYWFGSWQDGLYRYNGNTIIRFTTQDGLPDNRVEEIKEDKLGNIFFNTSKGLCQYNGTSFLKLTETFNSDNNWKLNPDDLWFKSLEYSGYVYRLNGENLYRLKLPNSKLGEDYILEHPNYPNPYAIYCIFKDSRENIWFGTATLGACRFNGESFDWISDQDVTEIHDGPANGVRSIAEDKNGDFWFNTEYRYSIYNKLPSSKKHMEKSKFYNRIKSIGSLDGKKEGDLNEFLSILKDENSNLWIALYLNGVWKFDGENTVHFPIQVNSKNIPIYCLYKDQSGAIWLGTHENGVFKFNGETFKKFTR